MNSEYLKRAAQSVAGNLCCLGQRADDQCLVPPACRVTTAASSVSTPAVFAVCHSPQDFGDIIGVQQGENVSPLFISLVAKDLTYTSCGKLQIA